MNNIKLCFIFLLGVTWGTASLSSSDSMPSTYVSSKTPGLESEDAALSQIVTLNDGRRFVFLMIADGNGGHGHKFHDDVVLFAKDITNHYRTYLSRQLNRQPDVISAMTTAYASLLSRIEHPEYKINGIATMSAIVTDLQTNTAYFLGIGDSPAVVFHQNDDGTYREFAFKEEFTNLWHFENGLAVPVSVSLRAYKCRGMKSNPRPENVASKIQVREGINPGDIVMVMSDGIRGSYHMRHVIQDDLLREARYSTGQNNARSRQVIEFMRTSINARIQAGDQAIRVFENIPASEMKDLLDDHGSLSSPSLARILGIRAASNRNSERGKNDDISLAIY